MTNPPDLLIEALKDRNAAIAIVGSGLSFPAGAPSWEELLYGLVLRADERCFGSEHRPLLASAVYEIQKGGFLRAAALIKQVLGDAEFRSAIVWWMGHKQKVHIDHEAVNDVRAGRAANRLCAGEGKPTARALAPTSTHRILMQLGFRAIITTNYDWLLETALGSFDVPSFSYSYPHLMELVQRGQRFILHLHGDLRNQRDLVLAEDDFQKLRNDLNYLQPLDTLLRSSIPLWLGYGHNDPDLTQITWKLPNLGLHGGYQLVDEKDLALQTAIRQRGITPLPVSSYDEIPEFLSALAAQANKPLKISIRIDLPVADHREMNDREISLRQTLVSLGYDLDKVTGGLGTSAQLIFDALNSMGRNVTDSFVAPHLRKVPDDPFEPQLELLSGLKQIKAEALFESWIAGQVTKTGQRIAIVASLGAGKTVLLFRFAQWLRSRPRESQAFGQLTPIILVLTPANIPESHVLAASSPGDALWEHIRRRVSTAASAGYSSVDPGIFEPFRKAGLIYLLFDGLDEFGARRRGDLEHLMTALRQLAEEKQIHLLLTCRKVFWDQQVPKDGWQQLNILPFTVDQINARVPYPGLGKFAYDEHHQPRPGVFNPLIASFVIDLSEGGKVIPEFRTRSELYDCWSRDAARKAQKRFGPPAEQWLEDFQNLAYQLLKEERLSVPPLKRESGPLIQFHEYMATEILVPSGDSYGLKFFHESVHEFFVASYLTDSFQRVLLVTEQGTIAAPALAEVDLDFHQTSVYGFLHEKLGQDYLTKLLCALRKADLMSWPARLVRNLIEYVGMTYKGNEELRDLARWLLGVIRNDTRYEIRYNAARALERIHPWAPRPYFDYMSDWGDRDWSAERHRARSAQIKPCAIRGQRTTDAKYRRRPGTNPPLALCSDIKIDPDLQQEISLELLAILKDLLAKWRPASAVGVDEPSNQVDWLLINCTHALVRWYHAAHREQLEKLKGEAERLGASKHVQSNLRDWVANPLCLYPPIDFPFTRIPDCDISEQIAQVVALEMSPADAVPVPSIQEHWNRNSGIVRGMRDRTSGLLAEDHVRESLDTEGRLVSAPKPIVGWEEMRSGVWTVADHVKHFSKMHPEQEVVAWVGNGNLLYNPHFVTFARNNGQAMLYHLRSEESHFGRGEDSREYTCFIVRRDGCDKGNRKVSIESLRFWYEDGCPQVFSVDDARIITDEIEFATFGQRLVAGHKPLDRASLIMMATEGQFYDLRHLFLFGRLARGEQRWLDVGLSAFWDEHGNLDRDVVTRAVNAEANRVDVSQFDEGEVRRALLAKGYTSTSCPRDIGEYELRRGVLSIVFKDGIYPHSMIGLRDDGKMVVVAVRGLSNRVGVSVLGAAEIMRSLGARDAILIDNGRDVLIGYRGEAILGAPLLEDSKLRAMTFFSCPVGAEDAFKQIALLEFPKCRVDP